ncbi:hypothetical protein EDB85DRAFT_2276382 [Lactarius pseudohatsudake]|nr:hypothetical protein EDB85DRAFT_2276382 [Lactarius pseudohatsudake]
MALLSVLVFASSCCVITLLLGLAAPGVVGRRGGGVVVVVAQRGWVEVVMWHAGLRVVVVSGRVDSHGVLRAADWRGGGAARRVAGLRSRVGWAGWWSRGFARGVGVTSRRGFCAGGVGGDASERGICAAGYWWRLRETRQQVQVWRGDEVAAAVTWSVRDDTGRKKKNIPQKPSSSSSAGVLRVATAWRRGRVLVEVEGDGATSLGVARRLGSRSGDVVSRPKPSLRVATAGWGGLSHGGRMVAENLRQRWRRGLWANVWRGGGGDVALRHVRKSSPMNRKKTGTGPDCNRLQPDLRLRSFLFWSGTGCGSSGIQSLAEPPQGRLGLVPTGLYSHDHPTTPASIRTTKCTTTTIPTPGPTAATTDINYLGPALNNNRFKNNNRAITNDHHHQHCVDNHDHRRTHNTSTTTPQHQEVDDDDDRPQQHHVDNHDDDTSTGNDDTTTAATLAHQQPQQRPQQQLDESTSTSTIYDDDAQQRRLWPQRRHIDNHWHDDHDDSSTTRRLPRRLVDDAMPVLPRRLVDDATATTTTRSRCRP